MERDIDWKPAESYAAIDLETTGLDPKIDGIVEIGIVKVIEGVAEETYQTFVKPCRLLSERITQLTGIRQEDVEAAPELDVILPEVLAFVGELPLLGHRVLFDYSFLKRAAVNRKLSFERKGIDTLGIARRYLPQLSSRSLSALCSHYEIPHQAHRALEDAMAAHQLYGRLKEQFWAEDEASGVHSLVPKPLVYKVKRETPATQHQKERLYQLIEQHKLKVDYHVEQLTRNQASRYTDIILAEYGRCADGKQNAAARHG